MDTTCPLHRVAPPPPAPGQDNHEQVLDLKHDDDNDATVSSKDTNDNMEKTDVPDWLEAELRDAESSEKVRRNKKKKRKKHNKNYAPASHPHSVDSGDEVVRRLEKEYERRQQEIMLEAEAAVRAREEALNQELSRLKDELEKQRAMQSHEYSEEGGRRHVHHQDESSGAICSIQ